ncbi:MAG: kelch repeat-containing protein [Myxococcota bacterium]|nr:kelch repeat-containing protein [Myxococcota bacterium]
MKRIWSMMALAGGVASCSPTVDLKVEGAFMCVNRDYHRSVSTVKVQIVDPTGRNPDLADGQRSVAGTFVEGGLSLPAIPVYTDEAGNLDSAMQVRWYGSRSSNVDFAPEDLVGYGSTAHIWHTNDLQPDGTVYVPLLETGRFSPTTDLAQSAAGGSGQDICTQMITGRFGHTATYIPAIGKVLIVGGRGVCQSGERCVTPSGESRGIRDIADAELFDPATGTYIPLPAPPAGGRAFHSATLIGDDTVLIAGGRVFTDANGAEDVLGTAFLFSTQGYTRWLSDTSQRPWSDVMNMGPGNAYRRADHAAVSVDSRRAVLVGGVSDVRTDAGGYPNLRLEIVQLTNTLPGVIVFDLDSDRQTGAFKAVGTPLQKPRAGARLALRNSGNGPEIMVVGGYDAGNAVGAIEIIKNLNGATDQIQVDSFGNLQPAVFGHTATVVADKLVVYGGLTRFPDLSSDPSVNCTQPGTNAFCYLEHLRLRFPSAADGDSFTNLDAAFAEEVQVMTLALDQANVVNATRGDEQNEFYDKNMLRGRLWHEAAAVRGNALVVVGGLAKAVLGDRPSTITLDRGGAAELCLVGQNTVCNVPTRLVGGSQRKRFSLQGSDSGRAEFQLTSLPGDVLLVTGGRIGDSGAQQGESMQAATSTSQLGVAPFVR